MVTAEGRHSMPALVPETTAPSLNLSFIASNAGDGTYWFKYKLDIKA